VIIIKALEDKILAEGEILPGNILKVGSFLNQQIDVKMLAEMGKEIHRLFADEGVTKILTIEASGIAIAVGAGFSMNVPVVFAKKNRSQNVSGEVLSTQVESFTHKTVNTIVVSKEFVLPEDRILIVDDFLANGRALEGLIELVEQAGATFVGAAIAVETAGSAAFMSLFPDAGGKLAIAAVLPAGASFTAGTIQLFLLPAVAAGFSAICFCHFKSSLSLSQ